jgi:hypothetical protein
MMQNLRKTSMFKKIKQTNLVRGFKKGRSSVKLEKMLAPLDAISPRYKSSLLGKQPKNGLK